MKNVFLKVSSAFLVGGEIAKAGEVVEVSEAEAKDLLHRGKATLATEKGTVAGVVESNGAVVALCDMKKADLVALAEGMGIDAGDKTKAELIAAIEAEQVEVGE